MLVKYIYEFIGTFFLVLTVGMAVLNPALPNFWAPLAIGSILAVMVYAGGHISGGHYNPAVSFAVFLRGKLNRNDLFYYWAAQLVGAIIASLLVIYFKDGVSNTTIDMDYIKAFFAEFLFTFALCFVVLNVATARVTYGNSFFGFAIGFTVLAGAYAVGEISGAAFNPAVALGLSIMNLTTWASLIVFFIANLLGGAAAAYLFKEAHPAE